MCFIFLKARQFQQKQKKNTSVKISDQGIARWDSDVYPTEQIEPSQHTLAETINVWDEKKPVRLQRLIL